MDSVWVEKPRPIPKCSLRNHCIDLLLRQVFEQLCCTQTRTRIQQLKTCGQATNHRSRIQPRGTERFQAGTDLSLGQFLAAGITKQRPMQELGR